MFKAILQEMPQMVLPLINEAFYENYDLDTEIIPLNKFSQDPMVTHLLNYESLKMRDETEQLKRDLEQQKQKAEQVAKQVSLSNIEVLKKFGFTLTEDQIQEQLKCVVEQQKSEE